MKQEGKRRVIVRGVLLASIVLLATLLALWPANGPAVAATQVLVTYNLVPGWNLIAPAATTAPATTAESALDDIVAQSGSATELDRWLNGGWNAHLHNLPFNDFGLVLGRGYFVKVDVASSWQQIGTAPSDPVPVDLQPGWNLIGLPLLPVSANTAEELLQDIVGQGGNCSEVDRWLNGGWEGHPLSTPVNDFDLQHNEGYFVKCSLAITYVPGLSAKLPPLAGLANDGSTGQTD